MPIVRDLSRTHPDERVRPSRAPYEDRVALPAALSGCDCLVFIGSDGEADRMLAHHVNIIWAAQNAGVSRTVLLSSLDADPGSPVDPGEPLRPPRWLHARAEHAPGDSRDELQRDGHTRTAFSR